MHRCLFQLGILAFSTSLISAEHWAFRPLSPGRARSIDEMVGQKLDELGLTPAPRADARTLARRASYDLTGLPPEQTDLPYEQHVERLLASPHYGEQWARHWLDVARYSDTKGYVYAREEKNWVHATAYRDWVVRALNEDMPYDRFLLLQIAADQLAPPRSPDLAAMGFLTLGRRFLGVTHDIIDDRIDVLTRGTLGLTVACARCHDHKFDPIPTQDYYALYGVFQSSAEAMVPCSEGNHDELNALVKTNRDLMTKRRAEQMSRTRKRAADYVAAVQNLDAYPEEVFGQILEEKDLNPFIVHRWKAWLEKHPGIKLTDDVLSRPDSPAFVPDEHIANIEMYFPTNVTTELWKSQGEVDRFIIKNNQVPAHATILIDRPQRASPRVFIRGNPLNKGEFVPMRFLRLFGESSPFARGSGRLELAQAIAHSQNPLTARVMVNRIWQHHFGRGIVSTPSDFGKQGSPPSHPELLDWLALRFIESGWSLKAMHRLIMMSETYRRSSDAGGQNGSQVGENKGRSPVDFSSQSLDPENRWLVRFTPHRLSFEEARDSWLAAAGRLNLRIGGRPESLFAGANTRRTLYAMVDRENLPAVMRTFDFANPDLSIPQRNETTVPQQALFGLNHPFIVQQARGLIRRIEGEKDPKVRIDRMYQILFQRVPTAEEQATAIAYVSEGDMPAAAETSEARSWQYGFGQWDETKGGVKSFTPLPHFTGQAWQGDADFPNAKLGWAQLTASGGHPGNSLNHAVVRRWIAPADGLYELRSTLIHEPKVGDGIRAFVSHSRLGKLLSTRLHGSKADLSLASIQLRRGETLDFIVDIGEGLHSDQFLWAPEIYRSEPATGSGGDANGVRWSAMEDFGGQPKVTLSAWEQLAQVLMLSNEFLFVD